MHFEVLGEITEVTVIAVGRRILEHGCLQRRYGVWRWRKMKGSAMIRIARGRVGLAELHRYEAHGIGRKELKRKRWLE